MVCVIIYLGMASDIVVSSNGQEHALVACGGSLAEASKALNTLLDR